ncbi:MAG: type II toxin-antitoxin system VapC family toxin [Stenomitos frigidus ULC029]
MGISAITVAELEYGAYKSQRLEQNRAALNQFLLPLEIVPFDERSTQIYGELRATLERQGTIIGGMDLLIASQAIALNLTLVTNNTNEFSRIQNLDLDNWVS